MQALAEVRQQEEKASLRSAIIHDSLEHQVNNESRCSLARQAAAILRELRDVDVSLGNVREDLEIEHKQQDQVLHIEQQAGWYLERILQGTCSKTAALLSPIEHLLGCLEVSLAGSLAAHEVSVQGKKDVAQVEEGRRQGVPYAGISVQAAAYACDASAVSSAVDGSSVSDSFLSADTEERAKYVELVLLSMVGELEEVKAETGHLAMQLQDDVSHEILSIQQSGVRAASSGMMGILEESEGAVQELMQCMHACTAEAEEREREKREWEQGLMALQERSRELASTLFTEVKELVFIASRGEQVPIPAETELDLDAARADESCVSEGAGESMVLGGKELEALLSLGQDLMSSVSSTKARLDHRTQQVFACVQGHITGLQAELGTCRRMIAENDVLLASKDAAIGSLRAVLINQGEQEQRSPLRSARGHVDIVTCQALFVGDEKGLEELIASGQKLVSSLSSTMSRAVETLRSEKDRLVSGSGMVRRRGDSGEAQATPSRGEDCTGWSKGFIAKEALLPCVAKLSEISLKVQMVTTELLRELQLDASALLESESDPKQQMTLSPGAGERGKREGEWEGGTALNVEDGRAGLSQNTVLPGSSWREHVELR